MVSTLIKHGHRHHDLLRVYTIDQVQLYYKYAIEDEMLKNRTDAIIQAKVAALYVPMSSKKYASQAYREFKSMIDNFDPVEVEKNRIKQQRMAKDPMRFFAAMGIEGAKCGK